MCCNVHDDVHASTGKLLELYMSFDPYTSIVPLGNTSNTSKR